MLAPRHCSKPGAWTLSATGWFCALELSGFSTRPVTVPRPTNEKSRDATCPFDVSTKSPARDFARNRPAWSWINRPYWPSRRPSKRYAPVASVVMLTDGLSHTTAPLAGVCVSASKMVPAMLAVGSSATTTGFSSPPASVPVSAP